MLRYLPLLAVMLAGCTKSPPPIVAASGIVKLGGQPLAKAEVRFYPLDPGIPGDYIAIAVTDDQGRYTLMTNNVSGACACAHKVTVTEGPPPDDARDQGKWERYLKTLKNRPIPAQYASVAQTPLTVTVKAGQTEYPIELNR